MGAMRLSFLAFLNNKKEFFENLDFNSVIDTFAKINNRRKLLL